MLVRGEELARLLFSLGIQGALVVAEGRRDIFGSGTVTGERPMIPYLNSHS